MKKHTRNKRQPHDKKNSFKKSLVSYVFMLLFFAFLFLRVGVPSFVFFIIAIPMTISIIHKYIDASQSEEDTTSDIKDTYTEEGGHLGEEWEEEPLDLEELKSLRKEWKDSDFV